MLAQGMWWVKSKTDPRWNMNGEGIVGMFSAGTGAENWQKSCRQLFGDPPEDLEVGYHKY